MQKFVVLLAALAMACNSSQSSVTENTALPPNAPDEVAYAATITEDELKEHLYIYASDAFRGRETGSEGQKKASEYIRDAYKDLGIRPALEAGYFQKVPLELARLPKGSIEIQGTSYENGESFLTFASGEGRFDEITYVGYGVEEGGYSDYTGLDVAGKWLLMKSGEPRNDDGTYVLTGTAASTDWSNMSEAIGKRQEVAAAKGARGFFFVDDLNYARYKRYFNNMQRNNSGQMDIKSDDSAPHLILLQSNLAEQIYPQLDRRLDPETIATDFTLNIASESISVDTENVIAWIPGTTLPDEYVVISSHLDHIGVTEDGEVNNGADDDGSGTVAMLEIAEAFKQAAEAGHGPKRSVVFLHVTGEEKGLLGSRYYTDIDPVFPLDQTVANLNIDMIGRIDPKRSGDRNYIYLIGSDKLSRDLHQLSEDVNKRYSQIDLDYKYNDENDPNRFYYRSDHYNFAKNNIPIIFYFNGTHVDYHRPGDTPDKINYDLLKNRTQLIFHTAWEVANRETRLKLDKSTR